MRTAWISYRDVAFMQQEAERAFPLETGGVLMGYWTKNNQDAVIRSVIGPGPKAKHERSSFAPDYEWQEMQIACIYKDSGRFFTYLGDWHSHPDGLSRLSLKDRITLWRIANYRQARIAHPIMVILAGPQWKIKLWRQDCMVLFDAFILPFIREIRVYQYCHQYKFL